MTEFAGESSIFDYGVFDYLIFDEDLEVSYTPVPIPVYVYTSSMVLKAIIDDYEYFKYEINWYTCDNWEIIINRYKTGVDQFALGGFIRYNRAGTDRIGIIERIEKPLDQNGKQSEAWKISGRGVESIFANRLCLYNTTAGGGYFTQESVVAETAARAIVDKECISADASRNFTGLSLESVDSLRGGNVDVTTRYQTVGEALENISRQSLLSFKLLWSGSGRNFTFTPYVGTDRSATVQLTPDYGNVGSFNYLNSIMDLKNIVYVGGTGDAAARTVRHVYTSALPTGWDRREAFIDGSDCSSNDLLDKRGEEVLNQSEEQVSLELEYIKSPTFIYQTDFDIGDTITAVFSGVVTLASRIISVSEEYSAEGEKITIGLGKEWPDLVRILKNQRRGYDAETRR